MLYLLCLLFVIACGTVPAVMENQPIPATFQPEISTQMPKPINTLSIPILAVLGCWNIRSAPMVAAEVVRVQCNDEISVFGAVQNGFVRVDGGYICNQAFGDERECK